MISVIYIFHRTSYRSIAAQLLGASNARSLADREGVTSVTDWHWYLEGEGNCFNTGQGEEFCWGSFPTPDTMEGCSFPCSRALSVPLYKTCSFYCKTCCFLSDGVPWLEHYWPMQEAGHMPEHQLVGKYPSFFSLEREPNIDFDRQLLYKLRERITTMGWI